MHITTGTRIGSYEVLDPLGAGGMGSVYRATDHRLGREVAIKALPEDLAHDAATLERFDREARFLAALSDPNIATIFGVEEIDGERFLVLELVRGETLDARIARGPVPLQETLLIAVAIASGLEAAHRGGIIHRDLKPSNVKITPEGRVKILDFGIAKHAAARNDELSHIATERAALTMKGSMIGTPSYMSPEQMRGAEAGSAADLWAFGCLLYEMLTARRPFGGTTMIELVEAVTNREPDWNVLPPSTPASLRRLIARCLEKDAARRLADAGEARRELEQLAAGAAGGSSRWMRASLVAAVVIAIIASIFAIKRRHTPVAGGLAAAPRLTQLTFDEGVEEFPAWSPDGKSLVYAGETSGIRKLFLRRIGSNDQTQLTTGDHDDMQPAWSPDGTRVLFVRAREPRQKLEPGDIFSFYDAGAGDLWAIDLRSRRESRLTEGAFSPSISPDGRSIAVDASFAGPRRIWLLDAQGYNPQQLTTDTSDTVAHIQPRWSPDGKQIVYQRIERTKFDIATVDVATHRSVNVTDDNYQDVNPVWSRSGDAIFFSSYRSGGMNVWRIAIGPGGKPGNNVQQLTSGAGQDVQIALAPDGRRLAYTTLRQNADLWRLPLAPDGTAAGAPQPLVATTREDSRGAWSPDGTRIAFNSDRAGDMNIWIFSIRDGSSRQLTHGAGGDFQPNWSPDGSEIVFFSSRSGSADIWKVDAATGALTQLTRAKSLEINPVFSSDGREIAYQSDASGHMELWVMQRDGSGARQRSETGVSGHFVRWPRDGAIYFRSPRDLMLMKVPPSGEAVPLVPFARGAGAHLSLSPDLTHFIDVVGHKDLWLYDLHGGATKLFSFSDPDTRIDYPVWSPDGKWLLFDRFKPEGGDIWLADGVA